MKSAEYSLCVCGMVHECSLCVEQCVCVCEGVNRYEWAAIQATLHTCQVYPVLVVTTHNMDTHTHTHTHLVSCLMTQRSALAGGSLANDGLGDEGWW